MTIRMEKVATTNRWELFRGVEVDRDSKSDFTVETPETIAELGITPRHDLPIGSVAFVADQACVDAIAANYATKDAPDIISRDG